VQDYGHKGYCSNGYTQILFIQIQGWGAQETMSINQKEEIKVKPAKRSHWKRLVALAALIGLGGVFFWAYQARKAESEIEKVRITQVGLRDVRAIVRAQGKIRARDQVEVGSEISGRVIGVFVEEGQEVSLGDPLFSLDDEQARNAVARFRVAHKSAQTMVRRAELMRDESVRMHNRNQQLWEKRAIARDIFEASLARSNMALIDIEQAGSQLESAGLELARARESLKKTRVLAPQAGQVISVGIEIGQVIGGPSLGGAASLDVLGIGGPAPMAAASDAVVIADLSELIVDLEVDELDVAQVKPGAAVAMKIQGLPDEDWIGSVERVGLMGLDKGGATVFSVKASFPATGALNDAAVSGAISAQPKNHSDAGPSKEQPAESSRSLLLPGMTVSADIQTTQLPSVLAVPVAAIVPSSAGKTKSEDAVWVVDRDAEQAVVKIQPVQLGASDAEVVAVLDGLQEDDWVVEGPYRALRTLNEGSKVSVEEEIAMGGRLVKGAEPNAPSSSGDTRGD
jgi:HlyD family secretion protein